jgi:hypothetical protein
MVHTVPLSLRQDLEARSDSCFPLEALAPNQSQCGQL